ncbi:MAG: ADYC domain-containing protein [Reyranella sp.]
MRPAFLLVLSLLFFTTAAAAGRPVPQVTVEGTEFVVTLADGRVLRSRDLIGAILDLGVGGRPMRVRIAAVEPDPDDRSGTVWLHTLETAAADGTWANICDAGPDGRQQAFPLAGGPQGMELSCTGGAIAKCVRFGYRRWASTGEGVSLAPLHAACVRLVRGDYGGIRGWTMNGMRIDLYDDRGVQKPDNSPDDVFEAGWSPEGAVCVHHVRVKENVTLAELEALYPALRGRTGAICTEEFARAHGAIMFNRSPP